MVQTVTGNLVEVSSALWIEIFNGVKHMKVYIPRDFIVTNCLIEDREK